MAYFHSPRQLLLFTQPPLDPRENRLAGLLISMSVRMNSIVGRVAIDDIQIQFCRQQKIFLHISRVKVSKLSFHRSKHAIDLTVRLLRTVRVESKTVINATLYNNGMGTFALTTFVKISSDISGRLSSAVGKDKTAAGAWLCGIRRILSAERRPGPSDIAFVRNTFRRSGRFVSPRYLPFRIPRHFEQSRDFVRVPGCVR